MKLLAFRWIDSRNLPKAIKILLMAWRYTWMI